MTEGVTLNHDWVSPTGDTILDVLKLKNLSVSSFASKIGLSTDEANLLIESKSKLTDEIAEKLSQTIGASKNFWVTRETEFRQDLARRQSSVTVSKAEEKWLKVLPVDELLNKDWISNAESASSKIRACLKFFNVGSISEWSEVSNKKLASYAFKKTNTHTQKFGATITWLRQAEIVASEIETEKWDPILFHSTLQNIKKLTRESNPHIFLPKLKELCASCGVAVAIVKTPEGCRASGAAKLISNNRAILILSFRFLRDDQFWFSFFHEAGHLILHGNEIIFEDDILSTQEAEANDFAFQTLIPQEYQEEFLQLPKNHRAIIRFSKKLNISRGIVVGQLQKHGKLSYGQFNNLKVKYTWFA